MQRTRNSHPRLLNEGSVPQNVPGRNSQASLRAAWEHTNSIIPDPYNPLDLDRYSYVQNNPINYSDPTGHDPRPGYKGNYKEPDALDMLKVAKSYGVKFVGGKSAQRAAIVLAAIEIGHALEPLVKGVSSAAQAFSSAMGEVTATFAGDGNGCNAGGGNGFVCGTGAASDPRLFTHEFGHTFAQEYGNRPYFALDDTQLIDQDGNWVFGTHPGGSYERTLLGYQGDAPPYMYHGRRNWTDWDSNVNNVARNEDYADMFMNWVYNSFDSSGGLLGAGNQRYDWMTVNITETLNGR